MTVTQTVEIPASHRLTIDVPREVPAGAVILTFTPKTSAADEDWFSHGGECPICAAHRDPVTGEELFNAETIVAIEEGRAMMRGEIPALRFHSFEEMVADLERYDPDEDDCPMLEPIYPKIFRKQYKLMKKRGMAVNKLLEIMNMIISERPLPAERDNHQLHGKWKDMLECHIQGDWALVSSPKIG